MRFYLVVIAALLTFPFLSHADDTLYFSMNYQTARSKFLQDAKALASRWMNSKVRAFQVPSQKDKDLTVDYVFLPAQSKTETLVVITSGVHGMEAFAGSAIQRLFINEMQSKLENQNTGYLLVHSLNPYGFKNLRRNTENNVNLNRNFSASPQLYKTKNDGYLNLKKVLEPAGQVRYPICKFLSTALQLGGRLALGTELDELTASIGQGQYQSSKGIEYGGSKAEPQVTDFLNYLTTAAEPYQQVILLDLHTGLGESYQLHVMPGDAMGSVDADLFRKLFAVAEDTDIYQYTPNNSHGFYITHGDVNNVLPEVLPADKKIVAVTLEFGTIGNGFFPKLQTLNRLILENQGFQYGYANNDLKYLVRKEYAELFNPEDAMWKENVLNKSRALFVRFLERLKQ